MLKTVLENLDGLEEAVAKLYSQKDEKFILNIEGVDLHPEVANLKNAYERVKDDKVKLAEERDALKTKYASMPDDFDPDKWSKLKEGKADEAKLVELRSEYEGQIEELNSKVKQAEGNLSKFALDRDLSDVLASSGITDPALSKGAKAMLSDRVKTDENGKGYVDSDMGPIGLQDYVSKWVASEGSAFVTQAKGGGRKGSESTGNPQKKWSELSSSEKVTLHKENPEEYERVKAAG